MKFRHTVLENGLTIVAEVNPDQHSMAAGYFVRTGARDEREGESGVSHFLEHMLFKGTARRSGEDVNREFDEIGADYNAFTGEEYTVYYGAVLPEYQPRLIDLLTDLMRPTLRSEDFDVEKNVILEEIELYKDRPQFTVIDEARSVYYDGHPLGHSVLGTTESIRALTRDQMEAYHSRRYLPSNLVLALCGHIEWDTAVEQVRRGTATWEPGAAPRETLPFQPTPRMRTIASPQAHRSHIAFVAPGVAARDPRRHAADLAADILGSAEGSRLYWSLIEPGLADTVRLSHDEQDGFGAFFGYASCEPERTATVVEKVREELELAMDRGVTDAELARSQRKLASAFVILEETPRGRLFRLGFDWQYREQYATVDEVIDRYLGITVAEVNALLAERPFDALNVIVLGPEVVAA